MAGIGGPEVLLVLGVIMLLFGAKRLPEFARSLGKAKSEFKRGLDDEKADEKAEQEPVVVDRVGSIPGRESK